eukprot:3880919-Pyramimonas_sp.AAC.1
MCIRDRARQSAAAQWWSGLSLVLPCRGEVSTTARLVLLTVASLSDPLPSDPSWRWSLSRTRARSGQAALAPGPRTPCGPPADPLQTPLL